MPLGQISELEQTLASVHKLIAVHQAARDRLVERRATAIVVEQTRLDQFLAINFQTLAALRRTENNLREQLRLMAEELNLEPGECARRADEAVTARTFAHDTPGLKQDGA